MSNPLEKVAELALKFLKPEAPIHAIKWFGTNEQLVSLLEKLRDTNFLATPVDIPVIIKGHFSDELKESVTLIKWAGTAGQLVYLFELLQANSLLSKHLLLQAAIKMHFEDKNGKVYAHLKQIKHDYIDNKTGMPKKADELKRLVSIVKHQK
jgi:hypothetical protein